MSQQLTTIRDDVRDELGSPGTTALPDSKIDSRINFSYKEIATRFRHPELESSGTQSTSSGTSSYAISSIGSDYWYSQVVRDENNDRVLLYRTLDWIQAQEIDTNGEPQYYTRHGSNIIYYPTPNGSYTITHYYVKNVAELSADTDTTVFDDTAWDEIVKWGAVWRCFQMLGQQDRMIHARNIWRTLINSMPETEVLEGENSSQIAGIMDSPVPNQNVGPTS